MRKRKHPSFAEDYHSEGEIEELHPIRKRVKDVHIEKADVFIPNFNY